MANPYAYFDCLSICGQLQRRFGNASAGEIHLFAYFSCLLSLYKKFDVSWWGYSFSVTANGYPFSADVSEELSGLTDRNCIANKNDYLEMTGPGKKEYEVLRKFSQNKNRELFIEGACSTTLVMPVGVVRKAITLGPEIRGAVQLGQSTLLLGEGEVKDIYQQFSTLSSVIGVDTTEIMIPAIVWLTYMCEQELGTNNAN
jgi:hypothetical protein